LAENAVDNGVELRIRREVQAIQSDDDGWKVTLRHWEPADYVEAATKHPNTQLLISLAATVALGVGGLVYAGKAQNWHIVAATLAVILSSALVLLGNTGKGTTTLNFADFSKVVETAGRAIGLGGTAVEVSDMLVGGSGSSHIQQGVTVEKETVRAKYIVNCAGGASDKIARMIGDDSFYIKPRIGDYILLNRNQVRRLRWKQLPFFTYAKGTAANRYMIFAGTFGKTDTLPVSGSSARKGSARPNHTLGQPNLGTNGA